MSFFISETGSLSEAPATYSTHIEIASDPAAARQVQEDIEQVLKFNSYGERDIFGIRLALEEALVNAIKHGNQLDRSRRVHIAYRVSRDRFDVQVSDEGPGFDHGDVPDPTADENLERPCGRGLMLMRHYMTVVNYNARGNRVTMSKVRNGVK